MYLFFLIIVSAITYGIYKDPMLLNDIYYYWRMRLEEYMGINSFEDIYEDDTPIIITEDTDQSDSDANNDDTYAIDYIAENSIITILTDEFISHFQQKCIGFYFELLKGYSYMEIQWNRLLSQNTMIGYIGNRLNAMWNKFRRFTCGYLIEPDKKEWINNIVFYRTKNYDGSSFSYNIDEKYMFIDSPNIRNRMEYYIQENKERKEKLKNLQSNPSYIFQQLQFIVMSRCMDACDNTTKYIVSLSSSSMPSEKLILSKAKFMSIEYTHPFMSESIPLELPSEMLVAGNEILSAGFVLRALKHQRMSYVFDMDYSIKVIDGMVNMFQLKSTEYIVLTENGYSVRSYE